MDVIVEVLRVTGLPETCRKNVSIGLRAATYILTIKIDDKVMIAYEYSGSVKRKKKSSGVKSQREPRNDDENEKLTRMFKYTLSKTSGALITIDCKHAHFKNNPHTVSTLEIKNVIGKLAWESETNISLEYAADSSKRQPITLSLKVLWDLTEAKRMQFQVSATKQCLYIVSDLEGLGIVSKILKSERGLSCPEWINLLGSMGSLFKVAEVVADAYTNTKLVLSATQAIFEMFMEQQERDERILRLIQLMASLYQMILESEPLENYGQVLKQSISDLIALTRKCAYFINHYLKTYSFAQRAVQAPFSGVDEIISQFEKQFFILKDVFTTGIALSIGQVNVRILKNLENVQRSVDHIVDMISLPVLGRSWKKSDGCLEGTQETLLSKIYEWGTNIKDETSPNIFLLLGGSKCGKTAVSYTVTDFFHSQRRLGATVFFDSSRSNSCKEFFSSIIRELRKYDPAIRDEVMLGLRNNEKFINDPPLRQFKFLDSHMFSRLNMVGPTVIVVDGLDKCIDRDWGFLAQLSKFPENIRLLITSQVADDIMAAFRAETYLRHNMTLDDELDKDYWESLDAYISTFLNTLEASRPSLFRKHSRQDLSQEIYLKSFGIYILAQAMLEFVATVDDDVARKFLDLLLSSSRPEFAEQAREYISRKRFSRS